MGESRDREMKHQIDNRQAEEGDMTEPEKPPSEAVIPILPIVAEEPEVKAQNCSGSKAQGYPEPGQNQICMRYLKVSHDTLSLFEDLSFLEPRNPVF